MPFSARDFFLLIQSEGPISPTWAQSKDVKVSTFPGVKLVKSTEVSGGFTTIINMAITDDEIERLIEEAAKYPHLYIVKRGDYKDQVKRKNAVSINQA